MKSLKIFLIIVLFSLFVAIISSFTILVVKLLQPTTEVAKDETLRPNRNNQKLSSTTRIPNNKLNVVQKRRSAMAPNVRNRATKQSGENNAPTNVIRKIEGSPRFPNRDDAVVHLDSVKYICNVAESAECAARTSAYGELLQKELNRVMMYDSYVYRSGLEKQNTYQVQFGGAYGQRRERQQLMCALGGVAERTVVLPGQQAVAERTVVLPGQQAAAREHAPLRGLRYDTCAVVASAGALLGSRLGQFIDSHDMVLRFNNAPTDNYTEDVGSKTTIRILNSQIVAKPEFHFLEDELYCNVSILIWDPANYNSTLEDWYRSPDHPLFQVYKRFVVLNPDADIHLLNPRVLWDLWDVLQASAPHRIKKNPPSSGFLGLWFALSRCENVRMFEYVPSARATARCHYYSDLKDHHCTLGSWHPLAQEKTVANQMRNNSDFEVYQRGFINIPGLSSCKCPD